MAIVLTSTKDYVNKKRSTLLLGYSKSGRTQLAATYPNPLFVDTDKGLSSISDKDIKVVDIEYGMSTSRELALIINAIKKKEVPFDKWFPETLIVDSITAVSYMMEQEIRQNTPDGKDRKDGLFMGDYNIIQTRLFRLVNSAKELPLHLVVIANMEVFAEEGLTLEVPALTGKKLGPQFPHLFDEVYHISKEVIDKQEKYFARFIPTKTMPFLGSKNKALKTKYPTGIVENPTYQLLNG